MTRPTKCDRALPSLLAAAAERDDARRMLAECYRLSGADTDGNDWPHLWAHAVDEVRTMRAEHEDDVSQLVEERDAFRDERDAFAADAARWREHVAAVEAGRVRVQERCERCGGMGETPAGPLFPLSWRPCDECKRTGWREVPRG